MNTPITTRDLTKQAPHSPRVRIAGFVIASRAVDKSAAGGLVRPPVVPCPRADCERCNDRAARAKV